MEKSGKVIKVLKIFLIAFGAFLLLWYLAPLVSGIFNIGNAVGITASTAVILCGAFLDKMPGKLRAAVLCVIIAAVVLFLSLFAYMARYMNYNSIPVSPAETVIVLGCKVDGSQPSLQLKNRCDVAAEFLKEKPYAVAVLSGGQGADEDISEAECMKRLLVKAGIDESRLYLEESSTNTRENLVNSYEIIKANSLPQSVLVVTNEYHECRAMLICRDIGLDLFNSRSCKTSTYCFLTFLTRDMMGVVKELIF